MQMNFGLKYDVVILYCSHVNLGEEPYPTPKKKFPQMENGYPPNLKNKKLEVLESKMNFPPK